MRSLHLYLASALLLIHTACGAETTVDSPGGEGASTGHHGDIAWFDGTVDDAFALAAEQNKPLFLYWAWRRLRRRRVRLPCLCQRSPCDPCVPPESDCAGGICERMRGIERVGAR